MPGKSREKFKIYKNVFDDFTLQTLYRLSSQGHFSELMSPVKKGKESNVFLADSEEGYVIVKIYRLQSCNFNKMFSYIKSDPRYINLKNRRRLVIFKWVQREYRNLLLARERVNVPMPIAFLNNVLVMESIGGVRPALQLKDNLPKDIKGFFSEVMKAVMDLAALGLVHGDLSEYNILNHEDKPYFIDFSQATSVKDPGALEYVKRDICNVLKFFSKKGLFVDADKEYRAVKRIIEKKK